MLHIAGSGVGSLDIHMVPELPPFLLSIHVQRGILRRTTEIVEGGLNKLLGASIRRGTNLREIGPKHYRTVSPSSVNN